MTTTRTRLIIALLMAVTVAGCEFFTPPFKLFVTFESAGGLETGSAVQFNGVSIGRVNKIEAEEAGALVSLRIDPGQHTLVQKDAVAVLVSGTPSHIEIYNPSGPAPAVESNDRLAAANNEIELALWQMGDTATDLSRLLDSASVGLKQLARAWQMNVGELQAEIGELSEEYQAMAVEIAGALEQALEDMATSSREQLDEVAARLEAIDAELRALAAEGENELVSSLQQFLDDLNEVLERRRQLQQSP